MGTSSRVILADKLAYALWGQAVSEDELAPGAPDELTAAARRSRLRQEALALLVLFDEVIVLPTGGGVFSVPRLEDAGVLTVLPEADLAIEKDFQESGWYRSRDQAAFRSMLERTFPLRPLVLDYLMKQDVELVSTLARSLCHTRRTIYNSMLDFAYHFAVDDADALARNLLTQELPEHIVNMFLIGLQEQEPREGLNGFDVVLFGAGVVSSRFELYRDLAEQYDAGVATRDLTCSKLTWSSSEAHRTANELAGTFALVRAALDRHVASFPRIDGITHALRLRKDPRLRAFRSKLLQLQSELRIGDVDAASRVLGEVEVAVAGIRKKHALSRPLRWTTYAAMPATVVESLLLGAPVLTGALSLASGTATVAADWFARRHGWVLFGR